MVAPWANPEESLREYGVNLTDLKEVKEADCVVFAVSHLEFKELSINKIDNLFKVDLPNEEKIIIDVKSLLDKDELISKNYSFWRL